MMGSPARVREGLHHLRRTTGPVRTVSAAVAAGLGLRLLQLATVLHETSVEVGGGGGGGGGGVSGGGTAACGGAGCIAQIDPVTGLGGRAVADRAISGLGVGDGLIVFDLDHFKGVNDRFGHIGGDQVLCELGQLLSDEIRVTDVAARYGGDEIVVALRSADDLEGIALRLMCRWRAQGHSTTLSAGLAVRRAGEAPWSVFARADAALYEAKRRGRDRLMVAA